MIRERCVRPLAVAPFGIFTSSVAENVTTRRVLKHLRRNVMVAEHSRRQTRDDVVRVRPSPHTIPELSPDEAREHLSLIHI